MASSDNSARRLLALVELGLAVSGLTLVELGLTLIAAALEVSRLSLVTSVLLLKSPLLSFV